MEEKYRRLFELSDEDFEKAISKLSAEKFDIPIILGFLNYHNSGYLRKVRSILTMHFRDIHCLIIDFALMTSKDPEEQKKAMNRLETYTKICFDFQELLILRNSDNTDMSDMAHRLMYKHFTQELKMTGEVEQVVSLFM